MDEQVRPEANWDSAVRFNRAILECAGEGIYGLDTAGVTTFANPAASLMTGWPVGELLGRLQHAQIHHSKPDGTPYPRENCPIYAALNDGQVHHKDDEVFWRKDGTSFPVAYTSTPLHENGKLVGAVVVFRDITDRKKRELWDLECRQVLEMVATNAPLDRTLSALSAAFSRQHPDLPISVVLEDPGSVGAPAPGLLCMESGIQPPIDPVAWSGRIVSASGVGLGRLEARCKGKAPLSASALEELEMALGLSRIAIEHRNLLDQLAHQSTHDVLTGLANRVLFEDRLEQALAAAKQSGGKVAVFYLDMDRFKEVNDAFGHAAGDSFLRQTADRIRSVLRTGDTLARMGGDEFAVIVPGISGATEATAVLKRVREAMVAPLVIEGRQFFATLSLGFSLYPQHGEDSATLQKHADQAMYRAKAKGGNRFEIFDVAASVLAQEKTQMESLLREALEKNWLRLEYQPQLETTGKLIGMEALVRLQPPGQETVGPARFIPIAESTGLIVSLGTWVLREACRQGAEWRAQGYADFNMAVNVSAKQFINEDFAGLVESVLAETGFPARLLDIELTESCVMNSAIESLQQLNQLRALGVQISIDDFGTGYSSLSRLHQLPVSTVKIAKQFIDRVAAGSGGFEIVEAISMVAKQLGFRVIAEGVETENQLDALSRIGPCVVQGYLFGRPENATLVRRHFDLASDHAITCPNLLPILESVMSQVPEWELASK